MIFLFFCSLHLTTAQRLLKKILGHKKFEEKKLYQIDIFIPSVLLDIMGADQSTLTFLIQILLLMLNAWRNYSHLCEFLRVFF